jgi:hypothetical protein
VKTRLALAGFAGVLGVLVLSPAVANASPTVPHSPKVPAGLPNGQVIVLRPHRADLISNHAVVRVVPLPYNGVGIEVLVRAIGDNRWATVNGGTVTLRAGLVQRPHTELRIGPSTRTLRLTDSVSFLSGTSATVVFEGVTVVSASGDGTAPESDHRPYVRYTNGSTLTATGATFQALGSRSSPAHPGVTVGSNSTVTATDTTFKDSGRGLDVYRATRATLTRVTASGNGGAGILVDQTKTTTLADVTATGNASGVVLRGPLPSLSITGAAVHATQNGTAGVVTTGLGNTPAGPFHTDHNPVGLLVRQCAACVLTGLDSNADRRGATIDRTSPGAVLRDSAVHDAGDVAVNVVGHDARLIRVDAGAAAGATSAVRLTGSATGTDIDGGTVSGGQLGISVRAPHVTVTGTTVEHAKVGISIEATAVTVADTTVRNSSVGFRVNGHADGAVLRQDTADQNTTGLVAQAGPGAITVAGLRVVQNGGTGVRSSAGNLTLSGARIDGATIGLNLRGYARVHDSTVAGAAEAVNAGANGRVELRNVVLGAHVLGLRVAQSASVTLTDSTVSAPLGAQGNVKLMGSTRFPALPLSWLGIFAMVAVTGAVVLELMRKLRERGGTPERRVKAPAHVLNTA